MKFPKTKTQIRNELAAEIEAFLHSGGAVKSIPTGVSGNESNLNIFSRKSSFEPRQTRTPLNEVVKTLELRKATRPTNKAPLKPGPKRPQKKIITDDFGEPLRWVWDE